MARTATLTLESDAPETVAEEARQAARRLEGFVSHAEIAPVSEHARRVTMTLRVPAARLETLLTSLRSLGAVRAESLGSKDVTLEVVDVEARLRNHEALEARFLELLKSATTLTHAIEIERELGRVRTERGSIEGRLRTMRDQVDLATVKLSVEPSETVAMLRPTLSGEVGAALRESSEIIAVISGGLVRVAAGLLPFGVVVAGIVLILRVWMRPRRRVLDA